MNKDIRLNLCLFVVPNLSVSSVYSVVNMEVQYENPI